MKLRSVKYWLLFVVFALSVSLPLVARADSLDNWHARSSISTDNRLWGVAYGNNTFVAVGDNGTVLTSPDGIIWTQVTSGLAATNLLGVAFGKDKFVAVGANGLIITSATGETWVTKNSGFNNITLFGVAYGNNTFVAVGEGGTVLVSADGDTWAAKNSGKDDYLADVTFGNDVFVAVGNCNSAFTSSNGETWNQTMVWWNCSVYPLPELTGVAYGNNTFVAVGFAAGAKGSSIGSVFISQNNEPYASAGEAWTEIGISPVISPLRGVAFGYNTFVAVGDGGAIYASPDGIYWTARDSGVARGLLGATFAKGAFTAVGYNATILQSDPVANLIVSKAGTGAGTVTPSSGTIIWSGDTGAVLYIGSPIVTLTATADAGSTFAGWRGACSGTDVCTVTINAFTTVTAEFNLNKAQQFTLSVIKLGKGTGTVTSSLSDIACGPTCSALYDVSSQMTLAAQADASSTFNGWSGACTGTGTCTVTMDSDKTITATFTSQAAGSPGELPLFPGWNFISFPRQPPDTAIGRVLKDISPNVLIVWGYQNQTKAWLKYKGQAGAGGQNTLVSMEVGKGYWIYMNSSGIVDMTGWTALASSGFQLNDGWNLVGYSGDDATVPATALSSVSDIWKIVWTWDNGLWSAKSSDNSVTFLTPVAPLAAMKQGKAYWVKTKTGQGNTPLTGGVFTSGSFKVTVAEGTMPAEINAITPQARPESVLPDALQIKAGETNITAGAKAYTLILAENGFSTTSGGAVTVAVPFDPSGIPDPTKLNSLNVYVRIWDPSANITLPVHGRIVGNQVVVEMRGLPARMSLAVICDPDMYGVAVFDESKSGLAFNPEETSYTWGAKNWYISYKKAEIYGEVQKYLGTAGALSDDQIRDVVKNVVGKQAVGAANMYRNAGFRSPNLHIDDSAADPGGEVFGATPRYTIYFTSQVSSQFKMPNPKKNTYVGSIYIGAEDLNCTRESTGDTILNSIAHEMFHAVQSGYELDPAIYNGISEGTAAAYGISIDEWLLVNALAKPDIRQLLDPPGLVACETFKLSNYLFSSTGCEQYSNQDFFVYVARKYGNNGFDYLTGLFGQLLIDKKSGSQLKDQYQGMYGATDLFFKGNLGASLEDIYLDFVRQRAMEHNTESHFSRPNETVSGFASQLFNANSVIERSIDPLSVQSGRITMTIGSFSTAVLRIRPTAAVPVGGTGATLTLSVASNDSAVGDILTGFTYYKSVTPTALQAQNSFSGFGVGADDEITILLSNVYLGDKNITVTIDITGVNGSAPLPGGGGCGSRSSFTITDSSIPLTLKTPAYYWTSSAWANGLSGPYVVRIGASAGLITKFILEIDLKASSVTGPGSYAVGGSDSNVSVLVYNENFLNDIRSISGTMNLTSFGTNDGDRMTGGFNTVVEDYNGTRDNNGAFPKYNLSVSFDMPWGCSEGLNPNP